MKRVEGWGRHGVRASEVSPESLLSSSAANADLARGLGRSYGDSSLPVQGGTALNTTRADRILDFDPESGLLRAEAGASLAALNDLFIPRGFFTPVTPGTKFVTLGGMVASDVHGKDQHDAGNFGDHVQELVMRVADGRILRVSKDEHPQLFLATIGGMGLTGQILEVTVPLRSIASPWIKQDTRKVPNLDAFFVALEEAAPIYPYTVGWIDCIKQGAGMGRGILMSGSWAEAEEAPKRSPWQFRGPALPFDLPEFVLGKRSMRLFNELFYQKHVGERTSGFVSADTFFYLLDVVDDWNKAYGPRGFTQYQCVIPKKSGADGVRRVLEIVSNHGGASFLAVIKEFGKAGRGMLSFPMAGTTLALDIAMRSDTQQLIDKLNEQTLKEGGRIYLTKDSLTRRDHFEAMEKSRLKQFNEVRDEWDPERRFRSQQSIRLMGDPK